MHNNTMCICVGIYCKYIWLQNCIVQAAHLLPTGTQFSESLTVGWYGPAFKAVHFLQKYTKENPRYGVSFVRTVYDLYSTFAVAALYAIS